MAWQKIWVLPLAAVLVTLSSFVTSYIIAVASGHVEALFPYISATGSIPPESCVFGQLLNMGALLTGLVMYLRHRQIVEYYGHRHQRRREGARWRFVSDLMLWAGYASIFGLSIVANFQESAAPIVHLIGAVIGFGFGMVYMWSQTIYSYWMNPKMCNQNITHGRLVLCLLAAAMFITLWSTNVQWPGRLLPANETKGGVSRDNRRSEYWTSDMEGYPLHVVSAVCELLLSLVFLAYFASFVLELRYVQVTPPRLLLTERGRQYLLSLSSSSGGDKTTSGGGTENTNGDLVESSISETGASQPTASAKRSAWRSKNSNKSSASAVRDSAARDASEAGDIEPDDGDMIKVEYGNFVRPALVGIGDRSKTAEY